MLPSSPLIWDVSKVPPSRIHFGKRRWALFQGLKITCKIVANNCQNQCLFDHFFGSDFIDNHVRVELSFACPFLLICEHFRGALTLDLLAPAQSKRNFSIWELLLNRCNFGIIFPHILRHLDLIFLAWHACKNKGKTKQEISFNFDPKIGFKKVVF